ncbi:DUF6879 family protein [Streptosporangium saharense]|uniref:DUF6879 family protein n=1 Tax=Streptosporangium saharense TaxID=1706840 RepID=UPI0036CDD2EC
MDSISPAERRALISGVSREALHLEARDNYGVDAELFARWRAGDREEVPRVLKPWCDEVREGVAVGKVYRRACVVSEPLSEYQSFMREVTYLRVEAGEDQRWIPRRLISARSLPGNDFWLLDGETVIFNVFSGDDVNVEIQASSEPNVVKFCADIFAGLWPLAIPHGEYRPT